MTPLTLGEQVAWLLLLSIPVACVSWTVTHEEVFREPREYCLRQSKRGRSVFVRKFFYLFTCEYCFSHYVSLLALWLSGVRLLLPDWRGAIFAWFALVWVANQYMGIFNRLRLDIKEENITIQEKEQALEESAEQQK